MIDPSKHRELQRLTLAILKAAGFNTDGSDIRAVTYHHRVGEIPTLEVEYLALPDWETFTLDGMELRSTNITFVPLLGGLVEQVGTPPAPHAVPRVTHHQPTTGIT